METPVERLMNVGKSLGRLLLISLPTPNYTAVVGDCQMRNGQDFMIGGSGGGGGFMIVVVTIFMMKAVGGDGGLGLRPDGLL